MARYVALLRGINVGGRNPIRMPDLRASLEADGFDDVRTYIQSGNVLFSARGGNAATLTHRIERLLSARFGYDASLVLRSERQLRAVVEGAPEGFGTDRDRYRSDVIFLMPPLTARTVVASVPIKEEVDRIWPGTGVVYFSRLTSRATQSRLSRIISLPIYKSMTIRNWNTTTKLAELVEVKET